MLIYPAVARDCDKILKRVVEAEGQRHARANPAVYRGEGNRDHGERGSRPAFRFRLGTLLFVVAIFALLLVVAIQEVQIIGQQAEIRQMTRDLDGYLGAMAELPKVLREETDFLREVKDIADRSRSARELQDIHDRLRSATDRKHK